MLLHFVTAPRRTEYVLIVGWPTELDEMTLSALYPDACLRNMLVWISVVADSLKNITYTSR